MSRGAAGVVTVAQRAAGSRWRVLALRPAEGGSHERVELKEEQLRPRSLVSMVASLFLPSDYPHSVASSYASFSGWHFVHMVAGSATGGACARCGFGCV